MIAVALACKSRLFVADEPTTALDVSVRQQILGLLYGRQTKRGMAVLLIIHDLNLVRRFADRVAVMERGLIVEQGRVTDIFANPQHAYTRRLLESRPVRNVVDVLPQAETAVQTRDLRVGYPVPLAGLRGWFSKGEFLAVKGASMQLQVDQTVGIVGESGSGKSTMALAVLGLLQFSNEVTLFGKPWGQGKAQDLRSRKQVQVVF